MSIEYRAGNNEKYERTSEDVDVRHGVDTRSLNSSSGLPYSRQTEGFEISPSDGSSFSDTRLNHQSIEDVIEPHVESSPTPKDYPCKGDYSKGGDILPKTIGTSTSLEAGAPKEPSEEEFGIMNKERRDGAELGQHLERHIRNIYPTYTDHQITALLDVCMKDPNCVRYFKQVEKVDSEIIKKNTTWQPWYE